MDKQTKDKKSMPHTQSWDKTDRNFQRTANEEDVKGEMAVRGDQTKKQDQNKSNSKKDKQH